MAIAAHNQSEQLLSTGNALDTLQNLVKDDLLAVNHTIVERMQSPVLMIPQLAGHLISSGGKRLRPVLTLLCSRLLLAVVTCCARFVVVGQIDAMVGGSDQEEEN